MPARRPRRDYVHKVIRLRSDDRHMLLAKRSLRDARSRRDGAAYLLHLLEERCLLHVAARGVYNDDLVCLLLELGHAFGSDLRRISFGVRAVERYLGFGAVLLQLVEGARTEGVGAHERTLEALALVHVRVFGACGGLAGSLQPDEHDDVGALLLRLVRLLARVEHAAQLVAHRLRTGAAEQKSHSASVPPAPVSLPSPPFPTRFGPARASCVYSSPTRGTLHPPSSSLTRGGA
eukprot:scaffold25714_cov30-Tisochrysis_lutea.AAC.10